MGGLEICGSLLKVLQMDYHSVVGSGNYWVTFVAQSQFVLLKIELDACGP